jgi:hypothetical protein
MSGDSKALANPIRKPPDSVLPGRCRSLGKTKERRAISIGEDSYDPPRIDLARVRFSRTKECGRSGHAPVKKILGDFPRIGQPGTAAA